MGAVPTQGPSFSEKIKMPSEAKRQAPSEDVFGQEKGQLQPLIQEVHEGSSQTQEQALEQAKQDRRRERQKLARQQQRPAQQQQDQQKVEPSETKESAVESAAAAG